MRRLFLLGLLALLSGCERDPATLDLPEELVVVSRNAPTTWFQRQEELQGPEYDLVKSFADYHNIEFRIESVDSIGEVLEVISRGDAHIAAAGLTDTEKRRSEGLLFGPCGRISDGGESIPMVLLSSARQGRGR